MLESEGIALPNVSRRACLRSVLDAEDVSWSVRTADGTITWNWSSGGPDPRQLLQVRRPTSGALSKHVPVRAFSTTTGNHLLLESGLEHDLVRMVDRDAAVTWIVSQPCVMEWGSARSNRRHVPDLLTTDGAGEVSLWDAKTPTAAASEAFAEVRTLTEDACARVGWRYVVFTGLPAVHRHNLIWLHGFRHRPAWSERYEPVFLESCATGSTLGELLSGADAEAVAVVWHLISTGQLKLDLTQRLVPTTLVTS